MNIQSFNSEESKDSPPRPWRHRHKPHRLTPW